MDLLNKPSVYLEAKLQECESETVTLQGLPNGDIRYAGRIEENKSTCAAIRAELAQRSGAQAVDSDAIKRSAEETQRRTSFDEETEEQIYSRPLSPMEWGLFQDFTLRIAYQEGARSGVSHAQKSIEALKQKLSS